MSCKYINPIAFTLVLQLYNESDNFIRNRRVKFVIFLATLSWYSWSIHSQLTSMFHLGFLSKGGATKMIEGLGPTSIFFLFGTVAVFIIAIILAVIVIRIFLNDHEF
ncbi:hypothetical protein [Ferroacidibacillus organovorans]|uniref:hypothetical protein n=1 Tax=Ferroacidibacillus organovorans TaxID=1765683 RepID=UPI001177CAEC|nr:hypothetical protein [Ferroacidibacillus organovorans]